ncbi:hypothetical protein CC205_13930 [Pseudomonas savastanoi pv. nerii]|uniref:Uncharacterized protein n=1 Tax=Pseudomonas savastanoi pv. nerii TaxID=360921 RepID=A0A267KCH2_PSESS|nr:hypothetical protein CC205_13930 [Pseudomonas savastanoi pv. nerii]RMT72516.1 hypothetical protein ALP41_04479 [Pseudomonas savastanoi pv. nerii]
MLMVLFDMIGLKPNFAGRTGSITHAKGVTFRPELTVYDALSLASDQSTQTNHHSHSIINTIYISFKIKNLIQKKYHCLYQVSSLFN